MTKKSSTRNYILNALTMSIVLLLFHFHYRIMNNEVMSALNMKGKGKSEKVGFARMNLYKAVVETVIKHQKNATEGEVRACTASILKYAPDRCGGAGRTNAEEN
ncbi:uncharacterized protein LOC130635896 isoform X3 [Hydractinia symbiolongicarpus]|nr:uncharacterized protein LOC130635896 isoform X3 [Hydractinia symbiolongicarpus]